MSEQYSRLFETQKNLYATGSPVVIVAGALLLHNPTNQVLAQLKMQSVHQKRIKAVKVAIRMLDVTGNQLSEPVEYSYLDLTVGYSAEFGEQNPIAIPEATTRSMEVVVTQVVFEDGSIWNHQGEPFEPLPEQVKLELEPAYLREYQTRYGGGARWTLQEMKDLWRCACGTINHESVEVCTCRCVRAKLKVLDLTELKAKVDARLEAQKVAQEKAAQERKIREEQARIENEEKRKKRIKITKIVAPLAICAVIAFFVTTKMILPTMKYNQATQLLETGEYLQARELFIELDTFKDSQDMVLECDYVATMEFLQAGKYPQAAIKWWP